MAVIGEIKVKVRPDTSGFYREAKAELEAIEKRLKDLKVDIKVEGDVPEDLKKAREEAEKLARAEDIAKAKFKDSQRVYAQGLKDRQALLRQVSIEARERAIGEAKARKDALKDAEDYAKRSFAQGQALYKQGLKDRAELDKRREDVFKAKFAQSQEMIRQGLKERERLEKAAAEQAERAANAAKANNLFKYVRNEVDAILEKKTLRFTPELDRAKYDAIEAKLVELVSKKFDLQIQLDTTDLEAEKFRLKRELEGIEAKVRATLDEKSEATSALRLSFLGRTRFVNFKPHVDNSSLVAAEAAIGSLFGGRIFADIVDDIHRAAFNVDRLLLPLTKMSLLLANAGSATITLAGNMFSLGSSIASISGAALALPGILGGIVAGLGITAVAAKDLTKEFPGLKTAFSRLQDGISLRFYDKASEGFRNLAKLWPEISKEVTLTSAVIGSFFGDLSNNLGSAFKGRIDDLFSPLRKSVAVFRSFNPVFANIARIISTLGAAQLPRLAGFVGDLAKSFEGFLVRKGTAGLTKIIDDASAALVDLGSSLRSTIGIFGAFSRAAEAAGGTTLSSLADTLNEIEATVSSATFQRSLTGLFKGARQGMSNIAKQSGKSFKAFVATFSKSLESILPTAGNTLGTILDEVFSGLSTDKFQSSLKGFFTSLNKAAETLRPNLRNIGDDLTLVLRLLGAMAQNVAAFAGPVLQVTSSIAHAVAGIAQATGPVGALALKLGLGAAVFAFYSTKIQQASVALRAFATKAAEASAAQSGLNKKFALAAGAVGFAAVAIGAQNAGTALGDMSTIIGGAASGLALGGPLGAAIGGISGAFLVAKQGVQGFNDAVKGIDAGIATENIDQIRKSLSDLTNERDRLAQSDAAKDKIPVFSSLQSIWQGDVLTDLKDGFAILTGQQEKSNKKIDETKQALRGMGDAFVDIPGPIRGVVISLNSVFNAASNAARGIKSIDAATRLTDSILAYRRSLDDLAASLKNGKGFTYNTEQGRQNIEELSRLIGTASERYRLLFDKSPAKAGQFARNAIKNIEALGVSIDKLPPELQDAYRELIAFGKAKARPKVDADTKPAKAKTTAMQAILKRLGLLQVAPTVSANTGPFYAALARIRGSLSSFVADVFSARVNVVAVPTAPSGGANRRVMMRSMDAAAVDAAKAFARKINSEIARTIKFERIAKNFADGFASKLATIKSVMSKVMKEASAQTDRALRSQLGAITRNMTSYRNGLKALDAAKDKLVSLRDAMRQMKEQIKSTFVDSLNPTSDDFTSFDAVLAFFQTGADDAKKFYDVIQQLIKKGLNQATLQQLLAAGPGAVNQAAAILSGGTNGIKQINQIVGQTAQLADNLGSVAGQFIFGDQISEQVEKIKKLEKRLQAIRNNLVRQMRVMVDQLLREARRLRVKLNDELSKIRSLQKQLASAQSGSSRTSASNRTVVASGGTSSTVNINYYAAPGTSSLSSEESLFRATSRARMVI